MAGTASTIRTLFGRAATLPAHTRVPLTASPTAHFDALLRDYRVADARLRAARTDRQIDQLTDWRDQVFERMMAYPAPTLAALTEKVRAAKAQSLFDADDMPILLDLERLAEKTV